MKKSGIIFASISMLLMLSMTGFASAQSPIVQSINGFINGIVEILKPILGVIIGVGDTSDIFFAKILILFLVLALCYAVLSKVKLFENPWVLWAVSAIVAILGVRFLTPELVQAIILPNSALAVAISAGIPFVIYFFFVQGIKIQTVRRVAWIFFMVIFTILYFVRLGELKYAANVYWITALLALIMMLFDGTIQGWFATMGAERMIAGHYSGALLKLQKDLADIETAYRSNPAGYQGVTPKAAKKIGIDAYLIDVNGIKDQIVKIRKNIK